MAEKKCPKCGKLLPEEARFCGSCRCDVSDVTPIGYKPPQALGGVGAIPNPAKSRSKIIVGIVVGLAILLLLMNLHVCASCGKPFIGKGYHWPSGSTSDLIDRNCAEEYYGYFIEFID